MQEDQITFNSKQLMYKNLVVGSLIYAVVLGFFDDYSRIVEARSFSTISLASIVLQSLTLLAVGLKRYIVDKLRTKQGLFYKVLMFFSVWLVMFLSKFIFVWVIDVIFGSDISIFGFFGILSVVLSVTILHSVADRVFIKLGDS